MPRNRTLKVVAGIAASFAGLVGTIILLLEMKIISFEMAKLMLVALLGIYVGFGILIAIYRLISKLE
jgi:xanthosine utilization system XapX-like protein